MRARQESNAGRAKVESAPAEFLRTYARWFAQPDAISRRGIRRFRATSRRLIGTRPITAKAAFRFLSHQPRAAIMSELRRRALGKRISRKRALPRSARFAHERYQTSRRVGCFSRTSRNPAIPTCLAGVQFSSSRQCERRARRERCRRQVHPLVAGRVSPVHERR